LRIINASHPHIHSAVAVCAMALVSVGAGMLGVVFAVGCVETAWQWKRRSRAVTPLSGSGISLAIIGYLLLALCLLIVLRIGQAVPEGRAALDPLRD